MIVLREPFLFDLIDLDNNTRRVGYIRDLIEAMQLRIPFEYEFYLSPGGNYGAPDENGTWNGMVGEVGQCCECQCTPHLYDNSLLL